MKTKWTICGYEFETKQQHLSCFDVLESDIQTILGDRWCERVEQWDMFYSEASEVMRRYNTPARRRAGIAELTTCLGHQVRYRNVFDLHTHSETDPKKYAIVGLWRLARMMSPITLGLMDWNDRNDGVFNYWVVQWLIRIWEAMLPNNHFHKVELQLRKSIVKASYPDATYKEVMSSPESDVVHDAVSMALGTIVYLQTIYDRREGPDPIRNFEHSMRTVKRTTTEKTMIYIPADRSDFSGTSRTSKFMTEIMADAGYRVTSVRICFDPEYREDVGYLTSIVYERRGQKVEVHLTGFSYGDGGEGPSTFVEFLRANNIPAPEKLIFEGERVPGKWVTIYCG